jgi:hypothetical protein
MIPQLQARAWLSPQGAPARLSTPRALTSRLTSRSSTNSSRTRAFCVRSSSIFQEAIKAFTFNRRGESLATFSAGECLSPHERRKQERTSVSCKPRHALTLAPTLCAAALKGRGG